MNQEELKKEVEQLIADIDKTHRYSMTRIYDLSNRVFTKTEKAQSCASCLIRKVKELRNWLDAQKEEEIVAPKPKTRKWTKKK